MSTVLYACLYVCIVITHSKGKDQLGKVANPARGQLNGENVFCLSPFAPKHLVSRDRFGSPVPPQPAHLYTPAESGAYLRDSSIVPRRRPLCMYGHNFQQSRHQPVWLPILILIVAS